MDCRFMQNGKRLVIVSEAKLRQRLEPVVKELGATDRERLLTLLPLIGGDGKARISECLKTAFPGKAQADAMKAFKVLRGAINKAAKTADVHLAFTADTSKRTPPAGRQCWFEGEDTTEKEIAQFSDESTRDVNRQAVPNTGLLTDLPSLLAGETPVRIFVSYARENIAEARELLEMIKRAWQAAQPPGRNKPDLEWIVDWDIQAGEKWGQKILRDMERSHIGLFLLSVESLGSEFIDVVELPHFLDKKPIIPVRLGELTASHASRLARFEHRQFAELPVRNSDEKLSYSRVRSSRVSCPRFVDAVLRGIVRAIEEWRGLSVPLAISEKTAQPSCGGPDDGDLTQFADDIADDAHAGEDRYVPNEGRRFSLGELEKCDLSKSLPEGKVAPAIEQLKKWLDDGSPVFAVLGELGIGKTTTLKHFTRWLLDARKKNRALPLPIFIDLRLYHNDDTRRKVPTLEELLTEVIRHHWRGAGPAALTAPEIVDAVQKGGALIIFDGLDEKMVQFTREQSGQFIRELWRILPPPAKDDQEHKRGKQEPPRPGDSARRGRMILSCRSHYFKDVITQNALLMGEYREGLRPDIYEVCVILPFSDAQVRDYLKNVLASEARADEAIAFFKKVHNLEELSRRPFLLAQIVPQLAQLEARQMSGERVLGITLYENLAARWMARDSGKTQFTDAHKLEMMEQIAADMALEGSRAWPWDKVEKWLGRYLAARPEVAVFYQRHSPDALHQDFRTATFVLRPDDSRADFRFAHSSLGEFFHARRLVRALDEDSLELWQIPMPSRETLDFAGQFLALDPRPERMANCSKLLAQGGRGAVVALQLWLIAVEMGYPQPAPTAVDLRGADLHDWEIRGAAADRPLSLRGALLQQSKLFGGRYQFVDLSEADFSGADAVGTRFEDCRLGGASLGTADFSGSIFRRCNAARLAGAQAKWRSAQWIGCDLADAMLPDNFGEEAVAAHCRNGPAEFSAPLDLPPELEAVVLDAHHGGVTCVAWSPDGSQLLSGSDDNTLRVWDAASGKMLRTFVLLPHGETAVLEPHRIIACSFGAWPYLAWHLPGPGRPRLLPAEFFGELPVFSQ
ncbi:MAG TPA: pentapeptide repeat-containing protein [Verrucomicrobiae bacterium]